MPQVQGAMTPLLKNTRFNAARESSKCITRFSIVSLSKVCVYLPMVISLGPVDSTEALPQMLRLASHAPIALLPRLKYPHSTSHES